MKRSDELKYLLEDLGIAPGALIYLHTSFRRVSYIDLEPRAFIEGLLDHIGDEGTLVMPSFSWHLDKQNRPWIGYRQYFETRPVFDVKNTPANIGIVPETFRNWPEARRSLSYWWSVSAVGRLADVVTADQLAVEHPYGPGSTFDLLRAHDVVILGLGVTLNTTSLAFVPDYYLGNMNFLTSEPQVGEVIDENGERRQSRSYWVLPEAVQKVKPEVVFRRSQKLRSKLSRVDRNNTIQFAYPYSIYHDEALRLGMEAQKRGEPHPWLEEFSR